MLIVVDICEGMKEHFVVAPVSHLLLMCATLQTKKRMLCHRLRKSVAIDVYKGLRKRCCH